MPQSAPKYVIEPLAPGKHDRASFICEEPALNNFIRKHASARKKGPRKKGSNRKATKEGVKP